MKIYMNIYTYVFQMNIYIFQIYIYIYIYIYLYIYPQTSVSSCPGLIIYINDITFRLFRLDLILVSSRYSNELHEPLL